jgi:7-cyano-7-deazaguanine synthase in queuosine biosynthesis
MARQLNGAGGDSGSRAIVLLSGGLDSYTAAAIAASLGFEIHALTIQYGQRHAEELGLTKRCTVLFSPSHTQLPARDLADWIIEDRLPVRFQIQLHKYLWGDVPGK